MRIISLFLIQRPISSSTSTQAISPLFVRWRQQFVINKCIITRRWKRTPPPTTTTITHTHTQKKEGVCVCFSSGVHKDVELLRLGDRADGWVGGDLSSPSKSTTYWSVWLTDRRTTAAHMTLPSSLSYFTAAVGHQILSASIVKLVVLLMGGGGGGNENIKAILKKSECEKRWFLKQPLCRAT